MGLDEKSIKGGFKIANTRFIPVSSPMLVGNEKTYVNDCLDSTWISSNGKYIEQFENEFAKFCNSKHAIACTNGTVALHLALMALGIGPGDEVIVPTLTYIATANAVKYCGAEPVLVDSEPETWNIDPTSVEQSITAHTKAIIVVHLYGQPVDMDPILSIARQYGLFVIEDAAEAHGAEYKGKRVGPIGDIGIFSFYGNKIITTGEGGMVVTNNDDLAERVRLLKGQGMDPKKRYWFPIIGYNYRMTNIAAAIGVAQLEKAEWHIERHIEVASWYKELLKDVPSVFWQSEKAWGKHVYWMFSIVLADSCDISRDSVMGYLFKHGIETRPIFYPMHIMPPYYKITKKNVLPVAEKIASRGINLPTWSGLTKKDVEFICKKLCKFISNSTYV